MKWLTIIEWYQTNLICLLNKNHMLVYYDWKSYVKWWGHVWLYSNHEILKPT